jgi:hypothetical protein
MRGLEREGDLATDRQGLLGREPAALQAIRERLALDQLHDQDRHAAVAVLETVQGRDAGMVEGGEDARLLPQASEPLGLARELVGQRLEGDLAMQFRVAGAVDLAHAPGAEPGHDLVGAYARSGRQHDGPP